MTKSALEFLLSEDPFEYKTHPQLLGDLHTFVEVGSHYLEQGPDKTISFQDALSTPIDLSVRANLRPLLSPFCRDIHFDLACAFLDRIEKSRAIEGGVRKESGQLICNREYGFAFPTVPEVLAYLMQACRNKTFVEIAAASGENSLLMAMAGARKVYVNDIAKEEMAQFNGMKDQLFPSISQRLVSC